MQEIRCTGCNKMLVKVFDQFGAVIIDKESVENKELERNGYIKRLEIKCPRCKTLNEVLV